MRKLFCLLAVVILVVCLAGGCLQNENNQLKSWKEWVKIPVGNEKSPVSTPKSEGGATLDKLAVERITIDLYFARQDGKGLEVEKREISKEEGIARRTIEELLKGPQNPNLKPVLPSGTKLRDINVKSDGLCIVDFNREITGIGKERDEVLAVYSVVNTLSQFPTVQRVSFMIEGEPVATLAGKTDLSSPVIADYNQ